METTKKMKSLRTIMTVVLLAAAVSITAQSNYPLLQEAFAKSQTYEAQGNYNEAITALKTVYQEDSYEINLRLGWLTYLNGAFTESSAYYMKAMKLKPYAIEPRLGYVYPLSALGKWDLVINTYLEILSVDSQHSVVNYRLASVYYGRKDYKQAEKYLEKVVNLYPFDYDSMLLFAWTNYRLGKLREAQVLFNKVLLNKPKDASALEGLSLIKF